MNNDNNVTDKLLWLRAAVMGANDGILSTASLMMGIAATSGSKHAVIVAGIAALFAGSLSMAAGEYVSVSSQKDSEDSCIEREKYELEYSWDSEVSELTKIYIKRGLPEELARDVAESMMEHDALEAHSRDELGIIQEDRTSPLSASVASAISFAIGAIIPILSILFSSTDSVIYSIFISTVFALIFLGFISSRLGNSSPVKSITRILIWGLLSLLITYCLPYVI